MKGTKDPWPEVSRGEPGPLYGIFGPEDFLRREMVERLSQSPAFAHNPMLNQERFQAGETPPSRIVDSANTLPFLAPRRLLIVYDIEACKPEELNQFVPYLNQPCPSTCLLFSAARLDSRLRFAKALQEYGRVITVRRPYPREMPAWLESRAGLRGKHLQPDAVRLLADLGEVSLMELDREMEKLSLFTGSRPEITAPEVHAVLSQGRLYSVFDLNNAITEGDLGRSLAALHQLLAMNEAPLYILAIISRLLRQWSQALAVAEQGGGENRLQEMLRTPPQVTRNLLRRARSLHQTRLKTGLEAVLAADTALKSSGLAPRTIMENLLFTLCAP
ncbi:MAG: DNA polymerase III subunit delta [Desulfarculales bacterium]|nr:DNA polymerase III subunit delta [Desulfarculales bacterium]